jgi:hypothetical protein
VINITISKRALVAAVAVALVTIPAAAAIGQSIFDDVPDTSTHLDGVTFVSESGVSVGCDENNNFCPSDFVSRDQMATFLYRLSGNDPATPPSVHASSADTAIAADAATFADTAGDADTVGGMPAADLMSSISGVACADAGGCENIAPSTETIVLQVDVSAPADGVVAAQYSMTGQSDAASTLHTWLTLDDTETCNFVAEPVSPLPGSWHVRSFDGSATFDGMSAASVFEAPAGEETVYLCAVITGDTFAMLDGQLSATWSGSGSGSTPSGGPTLGAARAAQLFGG